MLAFWVLGPLPRKLLKVPDSFGPLDFQYPLIRLRVPNDGRCDGVVEPRFWPDGVRVGISIISGPGDSLWLVREL
jgi:hypothetical protein